MSADTFIDDESVHFSVVMRFDAYSNKAGWRKIDSHQLQRAARTRRPKTDAGVGVAAILRGGGCKSDQQPRNVVECSKPSAARGMTSDQRFGVCVKDRRKFS